MAPEFASVSCYLSIGGYCSGNWSFVGCEGNEEGLPYQIQRTGNQHFLFASDFPHEIADDILHEIEEVNEAPISIEGKRRSCGKTPSAFTKFN
jgi:hypothetical protein